MDRILGILKDPAMLLLAAIYFSGMVIFGYYVIGPKEKATLPRELLGNYISTNHDHERIEIDIQTITFLKTTEAGSKLMAFCPIKQAMTWPNILQGGLNAYLITCDPAPNELPANRTADSIHLKHMAVRIASRAVISTNNSSYEMINRILLRQNSL